MPRRKRKQNISTETIERFRDLCLAAEAAGNHGVGHGAGELGNTDMRRGIWFWGTGRGWQLKRDWRAVFAQRWPAIELPPKPDLPKPPPRLSRKVLEQLLAEYNSYGHDWRELQYWESDSQQKQRAGWRVFSEKQYRWLRLGGNAHEAAENLRGLIEKYKQKHGLSGQEPQLGGQADRNGTEPMLGSQG